MTIEELQKISLDLPGVTQDIKWEDHLCFNIGGKMFLVTSPDKVPPTASFKVPPEQFDELIALEGFSPAQYLARYKWIYLKDIGIIGKLDWEKFILESYKLVASKLPLKVKRQLGISDI